MSDGKLRFQKRYGMLFFAAEPPSVAKNQLARLVRAAAVFGFWGFFDRNAAERQKDVQAPRGWQSFLAKSPKKGRKYPCTGEQEPEELRNEDSLVSQNNKSIRNKNTLDQNCHESEKGLALDAGAGDKTVHIVVLLGRIPWPRGAKGLFLAPTIPNNLGWGAWQFRGPKSVPWDWMIYLEDHPRTDASGDGNLHLLGKSPT